MSQPLSQVGTPTPSVMPQVVAEQRGGGYVLSEKQSAACLFWFLLGFTLLWNLIAVPISALVIIGALQSESGIVLSIIFPLVFLAVGIILIVVTIRNGLIGHMFGPGELQFDRLPLRMGEETNIHFHRKGRKNLDVTGVKARLICREWVRYSVGTDTKTQTNEIWSQELLAPTLPPIFSGEVNIPWIITIPPEQPPSFSASNNAIEWQIEVTLLVNRFPDPTATFLLPVMPEVKQ